MPIRRVSAAEASHLKSIGYDYLDVRAPEEFEQGHPVGARNVPYKFFGKVGFKDNPHFLPVVQAIFPKDAKILIIGKLGRRSLEAAEVLEAAGYLDLCELRPGYAGLIGDNGRFSEHGWVSFGLPTTMDCEVGNYKVQLMRMNIPAAPPRSDPGEAAAAPVSRGPVSQAPQGVRRLSATDAYKLKSIGYVFLDVRTPEEYAKGHPRGAVNLPWKMYSSGGGFKPNSEFLRLMEALYPKDKKILVIGKIGKRSLEAAEALFEAGFTHVCELRPGYKGIIGNDGHYAETGWEGLGLDSEQTADGNSYLDMIGRAGD